MIAGKLKLNPDKTEFILVGTKSQREKFKKYFLTKLLDQDVTPINLAQNPGVEFDKDFNFVKHNYIKCLSIMLLSYSYTRFTSLTQVFSNGCD